MLKRQKSNSFFHPLKKINTLQNEDYLPSAGFSEDSGAVIQYWFLYDMEQSRPKTRSKINFFLGTAKHKYQAKG